MKRGYILTICALICFFLVAGLSWGWTPAPVDTDPLVRMPGTQPDQGIVLTGPQNETDACMDCHGENEQNGAGDTMVAGSFWHGSMMAQAARDPLFWAAMTVAAQDSIWALGNPNAVDICERCHFPEGWLGGRSDPPNASAMTASDFDGVHCDVCHSMWDPFFETTFDGTREGNDWAGYWDEADAAAIDPLAAATRATDALLSADIQLFSNEPFYSANSPLYGTYTENGGGQYFVDPVTAPTLRTERKRGPFADILADDHPDFLYSRYHKSKFFCSTCHDVSNPALANLDLSGLPDNSGNTDLISEQYSAHSYFHVERTFSEFMLSSYGQGSGAATNLEFQVAQTGGAVVTHAARCQDCHMADVTGIGADSAGVPLRPDGSTLHPNSGAPLHNLQGGNAWITHILSTLHLNGASYDPVNAALLVTPGAAALTVDLTAGATILNGDAQARLTASSLRAQEQLQLAATLKNAAYDPVTGALALFIQNNTGHKLISGFPEGRRMFLNVKAYRQGSLVHEVNPYDMAAGTLKGLGNKFTYSTPAAVLPAPAALAATEEYIDRLVYEMHPKSELTGEEKTFHFVLATGRSKDNRIPPKGFDIASAPERLSEPVWNGLSAPDFFTADEYAAGIDKISLLLPANVDQIEITLYYQGTSREYIEFLRDQINGTATTLSSPTPSGESQAYVIQSAVPPNDTFFAGLKAWGDTIWDLWFHNHGLDGSNASAPGLVPFAMTDASTTAGTVVLQNNLDSDGDTLLDATEIGLGTDPFLADTDGDGVNDNIDAFPLDPAHAVTAPEIEVTPADLNFGFRTNGTSASLPLTIINNGNGDLVIGTIGGSDPLAAPFSITADSCSGQTIAPAASCSLTVTFEPATAGSFNDSFDIPNNDPDPGDSSVTVTVNGTGSATPVADILATDSVCPGDDLSIPFGNWTVGRIPEATLTVTNDGHADLVLGMLAASDVLAVPFTLTADNCSNATLAPAGTCTVKVLFEPTVAGDFSDSLDIPTNDPDEDPITISLSGTGLAPGSGSPPNNPPSAPELGAPADNQSGLATTVTFFWEASQDPDGDSVSYELYYSIDGTFTDFPPVAVAPQAVALAGLGFCALLITLAGLPMANRRQRRLAVLVVMAVLLTSLTVACHSSGGSGTAAAPTLDTPVACTAVSTSVDGLQPATTYFWKVVAVDSNGARTDSLIRMFHTQ